MEQVANDGIRGRHVPGGQVPAGALQVHRRQVAGQVPARVRPHLDAALLQQLRRRPREDHREPDRGETVPPAGHAHEDVHVAAVHLRNTGMENHGVSVDK